MENHYSEIYKNHRIELDGDVWSIEGVGTIPKTKSPYRLIDDLLGESEEEDDYE